ncbi:MAG TPA: MerR family transcriptional regulator [Stackebrandtia sp.]|jgi:DNA-binding transcriptional MerR regulator|uniref:MerR family transcriptional regulator n=1 Tax=Stackebrandtia sp. TaxID=2023065 RepID=UPI002D5A76A8|nr:MerR family transcriptional regulator [Stackebrandtia sp.]HZE41327.1 MerR family transcriptional regulator [Stackebrandtia sp.]
MNLSIGEVAARTGLSVHTLRFYENEELFARPVRRDSAGRRVFDEDDVGWLHFCMRLRDSGMPVPAIREYAALVRAGEGNEPRRLELLREHQERVAARLDELVTCQQIIDTKVKMYQERVGGNTADPFFKVPAKQG